MAGKCDRTPVDTLIRRLLNPRDRVCGGEKLGVIFHIITAVRFHFVTRSEKNQQ